MKWGTNSEKEDLPMFGIPTTITCIGRGCSPFPARREVLSAVSFANSGVIRPSPWPETALNWRKPDGGLKDMSCHVALLRLHRDGLIELPPPLSKDNNRLRPIEFTAASEPGELITGPLRDLGSIQFIRMWRLLHHSETYG